MLILCDVLPVFSGNLKINADYLVYYDTSNNRIMEVFYEIPFNALSFIKSDTGFIARYRIILELKDHNNNEIAAEVWERQLKVADYQLTLNRDSLTNGLLRVLIPEPVSAGRIFVYDLNSERQTTAQFDIKATKQAMRLRLLKSARPNPSHTYSIYDTIEIIAEFDWQRSKNGNGSDSVLWLIKKGKNVLTGIRTALFDAPDKKFARCLLPVTDSGVFTNGLYTAEAKLLKENLSAQIEFRIEMPFFYDDSIWSMRVEQLLYVATIDEMRKLKRSPRAERQAAWNEFWQGRDPNPSTPVNEEEEEYFARINYCEEHFSRGDRGYRSDRARVYVIYGPPDQIESRPFEIDRPAEEIWHYFQKNLTFVFVDRFGSGEFVIWRQQ